MDRKRCHWCNIKNEIYVRYHDFEWGILDLRESHLVEMLILETFQPGLSWECVLNKREDFRKALDGFDPVKISKYGPDKISELMKNPKLIRNRRKMESLSVNANVIRSIQMEYRSIGDYLRTFWDGRIIKEYNKVTNPLSDKISKDLKARGMKFVSSIVIYSFLQAVGIINGHEEECFLHN
jgi:DNA-3-methyladenine glycosylase I